MEYRKTECIAHDVKPLFFSVAKPQYFLLNIQNLLNNKHTAKERQNMLNAKRCLVCLWFQKTICKVPELHSPLGYTD